jgi:hypothetical protein
MPRFDGLAAETHIQLAVIVCTKVNLRHLTENTNEKATNGKNRINSADLFMSLYLSTREEPRR